MDIESIDFNILEWRKRKKNSSRKKRLLHSISKKLEKEGKTTQEFEVMLNRLSLEEVIALKLELSAKSFGGGIFCHPLWYSLKDIVRDAVLRYYWSVAEFHNEAFGIMGITKENYIKLMNKYKPESYFKGEENEEGK
jgi:hypothetical protein